ncbi:MAG: ISKra4 family transposase [Anaerolineae bacterium]
MDLEAWENAVRVAVLSAGADCLSALLEEVGSGRQAEAARCSCGERMESRGLKRKDFLSILGPVSYRRTLFQCPACGKTRYPGDEVLDLVGTRRSPGLRRMMARAGAQSSFQQGREDLRIYAGLQVSTKDLERVAETMGESMERWRKQEQETLLVQPPKSMGQQCIPTLYIELDGTGIPMIPRELQGRRGKQAEGSAKTREVKVGCVFTQTTTDKDALPVRDPQSTTFVAAIEAAEEFGWRLYAEALRRGLLGARRVVVLGDGAEWIRNLVEMHFPGALQIIDVYHAREHVSELCKLLWPQDLERVQQERSRWWKLLDEDGVETIIQEALLHGSAAPDNAREKVQKEIGYLQKNQQRMRYARFRASGLFVGSGVVEAGCKSLVGQRLKQSGMKWSLRGANAILALRCIIRSRRMEDYWESRLSA